MAKGTKLYKFNPKQDETWLEIADFEEWGIRNITRIDIDANKIAIVSNP